jgi:hypothetical protein
VGVCFAAVVVLTVPDVRIVTVALEGLENILKVRAACVRLSQG